jgi:hypothetical protein
MIEGTVLWPKGASVKPQPNTNGITIRKLELNASVIGTELVPDSLDPANIHKLWLRIGENEYVAVKYPNSAGEPQPRILYHEVGFPPPSEIDWPEKLIAVSGTQTKTYTPND